MEELFHRQDRSSWMCSGIIRRMNVFRDSKSLGPAWVDVWDSGKELRGVRLQLEWVNGRPPGDVRELLLDPIFGMRLRAVSESADRIELEGDGSKLVGGIDLRYNRVLSQ
ncbi:hypothetical protein AB0O28_16340 [Microbispora sp. NPDC088329]|uniref:hypothetical protein n=1 Tax=Microbispora sp. NPDC088329 TaxID=3154869 RepID=UPI00344698AD